MSCSDVMYASARQSWQSVPMGNMNAGMTTAKKFENLEWDNARNTTELNYRCPYASHPGDWPCILAAIHPMKQIDDMRKEIERLQAKDRSQHRACCLDVRCPYEDARKSLRSHRVSCCQGQRVGTSRPGQRPPALSSACSAHRPGFQHDASKQAMQCAALTEAMAGWSRATATRRSVSSRIRSSG
eukprot:1232750-Rhodomonas_salina.2